MSWLRGGTVAGPVGALLAIALTVGACSDESSGDAGSGGAAQSSSAQGTGGTGATGGEASTTGGQGGGGVVTEFVIDSLEADPVLVLGLPATVTFTAHVSHPAGPGAVVGSKLLDGAKSLGAFAAGGASGTWTKEVTFQPGPDAHRRGFVIMFAEFEDDTGAVAERTVGLQFDATGCVAQPDLESCRACFCAADPVGCEHYLTLEYEHQYCGFTCTNACSAFCGSVITGMPDPALIDAPCDACVPDNDDVAAFEDACTADVPECFSFLVDVYSCPQ